MTSDGDLTSVFRAPGADTPIDEILAKAAPHAVKLDAFASGNGYLPNLYARHGFRPVARVAFDPAIAPANWPEKLGKPDVVFMVRDPGGVTGAPEVQGNYVEVAGQVPLVSYDEALTRQELAVEAVRKAARKPGR